MSRIDDLRDAQSLMWESIEEAPAGKRAPLMAQWRALEKDISLISGETEKAAKGDVLDELAARRSARGGATARQRRSEGGSG